MFDDTLRALDAVIEATDVRPRYYRPPHGALTFAGLRCVRRLQLEALLWSQWGKDWRRGATPESIAREATAGIARGDVVLLHDSDAYGATDSWRRTAAAVPLVVGRSTPRAFGRPPPRLHRRTSPSPKAPVHNAAMSPRASANDSTLVRNESLRRGLTVLRALAGAGRPITAAELTRQTGIPGPTVARLLVTLEDETLAVRDAGGGWRPGRALRTRGADGGLAALVAGRGRSCGTWRSTRARRRSSAASACPTWRRCSSRRTQTACSASPTGSAGRSIPASRSPAGSWRPSSTTAGGGAGRR